MSENPYQSKQIVDEVSDGLVANPKMERAMSMLRQTKPWVRFISVMTFLGSALMVLAGVLMFVGTLVGAMGVSTVVLGLVYIAMGLLYSAPAFYLWRYADRIAMFVQDGSTAALASALEAQKSFWRFVGICMLVIMCVYAVAIIAFIVGTSVSALR